MPKTHRWRRSVKLIAAAVTTNADRENDCHRNAGDFEFVVVRFIRPLPLSLFLTPSLPLKKLIPARPRRARRARQAHRPPPAPGPCPAPKTGLLLRARSAAPPGDSWPREQARARRAAEAGGGGRRGGSSRGRKDRGSSFCRSPLGPGILFFCAAPSDRHGRRIDAPPPPRAPRRLGTPGNYLNRPPRRAAADAALVGGDQGRQVLVAAGSDAAVGARGRGRREPDAAAAARRRGRGGRFR